MKMLALRQQVCSRDVCAWHLLISQVLQKEVKGNIKQVLYILKIISRYKKGISKCSCNVLQRDNANSGNVEAITKHCLLPWSRKCFNLKCDLTNKFKYCIINLT